MADEARRTGSRPNETKRDQTRPNETKRGQTKPARLHVPRVRVHPFLTAPEMAAIASRASVGQRGSRRIEVLPAVLWQRASPRCTRLPSTIRRSIGLQVAVLLGSPVNWTAALALHWRHAVACAARVCRTRSNVPGKVTALERALFAGHGENRRARRFLHQGRFLTSVFVNLCQHGSHMEAIRLLLALPPNRGVNAAANDNSVFLQACSRGKTELVRLLLALPPERGIDPAVADNAALSLASGNDRAEIVEVLLALPPERGIDPAASDNAAMRRACSRPNYLCNSTSSAQVVRLLLTLPLPLHRGVDPAVHENLALRVACKHGKTQVVKLLLDLPLRRGVDPAVHDNEALFWACMDGHINIVKLLLGLPAERGVDPTAVNNSALRAACERGHTEVAKLLLALPPLTRRQTTTTPSARRAGGTTHKS